MWKIINYSKWGALLSNFLFCKVFFLTRRIISKWLRNCKNCTFSPRLVYVKGVNIYATNVSLGGTFFQDCGKITIWEWTIFGYNNMVLTQGYRDTNSLQKHYVTRDVVIGKKCRITSGCIILWWVEIWDNVIIWAWSVVTKSVPSNCFVAGNPAKVIKFL